MGHNVSGIREEGKKRMMRRWTMTWTTEETNVKEKTKKKRWETKIIKKNTENLLPSEIKNKWRN